MAISWVGLSPAGIRALRGAPREGNTFQIILFLNFFALSCFIYNCTKKPTAKDTILNPVPTIPKLVAS
jgi:hypothetical protein